MATQGSARPATTGASAATDAHDESHGHSLASWTLVALILVGTFLISLAIVITNLPIAIFGGIITVLGLIAGRVLQMAGFGVHPPAGRNP
jgi:hypothetical protein